MTSSTKAGARAGAPTGTTTDPPPATSRPVLVTGVALLVAVWLSAALFGAYILAFYGGAVPRRELPSWNNVLPRLYEPSTPAATVAIGLHLGAGAAILLLGCVQLIGRLRERWPRVHRVLGRVYVTASLLAGVGGLGFIVIKGTVGGPVMSIGFGLYGLLTIICAVQTYRHARARRIETHRAWALALFALAVGSWLYRMDYGFWFLITDGAGHTEDFHGWFDALMAFWFYLPNLAVVALVLRTRSRRASRWSRVATPALLAACTVFVLMGTWFFTTQLWGPAILDRLSGA